MTEAEERDDRKDDGLLLSELLATPLEKLEFYRARSLGEEPLVALERLALARWMLAELARLIRLGDAAPWWKVEAARKMLGATEAVVLPPPDEPDGDAFGGPIQR